MPFHTIAEQIALRAGLPVSHKGIVEGNAGIRALIQDEPGWDAPQLSAERLESMRKLESIGWKLLLAALAVAAIAAIALQASRITG